MAPKKTSRRDAPTWVSPPSQAWVQAIPGAGFAEYPHWKLLERLVEYGFAEEDLDGDGWDRPPDIEKALAGYQLPDPTAKRIKYLTIHGLPAIYLPGSLGPSYFLEFDDSTSADALGRAAGDLLRASRLLPAMRPLIRGICWALDALAVDDAALGELLRRLGSARLQYQEPLASLREPPDGCREPASGWDLEAAGMSSEVKQFWARRLEWGEFGC